MHVSFLNKGSTKASNGKASKIIQKSKPSVPYFSSSSTSLSCTVDLLDTSRVVPVFFLLSPIPCLLPFPEIHLVSVALDLIFVLHNQRWLLTA